MAVVSEADPLGFTRFDHFVFCIAFGHRKSILVQVGVLLACIEHVLQFFFRFGHEGNIVGVHEHTNDGAVRSEFDTTVGCMAVDFLVNIIYEYCV